MPDGADISITSPSKQFIKSTYSVITAISVFVIVYILLLISGIAIAIAMGWLGITLMSAVQGFITLLFGIGFILSGLMLVFFLIKFIFTKSAKRPTGYEIKEDDQPELFTFIRKVSDEVGTSYPKHVYLAGDVNASASFHPTIWSMFMPIRKNLTIGVGLVNVLNQSEFKAVLAHEFGHFSQRSMRFGGYVYHLNMAIHNLLYENEGYQKALNAWGRWHYILRFSVMLNIYIVRGIQGILRKVYLLINKSHLKLSREMEFHADSIATYVSGANNVVSMLRKLDAADDSYNQMLGLLETNVSENKRTVNMYELHLFLLKRYADKHKLDTDKNGLLVIEKKNNVLHNSQIILNNQWSSHPSHEDRERNVNQHNLYASSINDPAWWLFDKSEELQEIFTEKLYQNVEVKNKLIIVNNKDLVETLEKEANDNIYDQLYKGFYDYRFIEYFDINENITKVNRRPLHFSELLSDENCNLPKVISALNEDIMKLAILSDLKSDDIKSFNYKGVKHSPKDAPGIKDQLSNELQESESKLAALDKDIFDMFYNAAPTGDLRRDLIAHYEKVFKYQKDAATHYDNYNKMMAAMQPTYTPMPYSEIYDVINNIYNLEKIIKPCIVTIINEPCTVSFIDKKQREIIDKYLGNNWVYFNEPKYDNEAIKVFNSAMAAYIQIINNRNFLFKKALLDFQLTLIDVNWNE